MGLILGIAGAIAAATFAAFRVFRSWQESGVAEHNTKTIRQTTGVVMNLAGGIRAVLDALHLINPRRPNVTTASGGGPRFQIGRTIQEEEALP